RMAARARADVDHGRASGNERPNLSQELFVPPGGRAGERGRAAVPVVRIAVPPVLVRRLLPIGYQPAPASRPINLVHATRLALGTRRGQPAQLPPGDWG